MLKSYAAQVRYAHETAGITVDGAAIATDRDSQNLINGAIQLLNTDAGRDHIEFKQSDGAWVDIPRAGMIAIGAAVGNYVQACFSAERAVDAAIDAGTITATAQVDAAAWPATTITSPAAAAGGSPPT